MPNCRCEGDRRSLSTRLRDLTVAGLGAQTPVAQLPVHCGLSTAPPARDTVVQTSASTVGPHLCVCPRPVDQNALLGRGTAWRSRGSRACPRCVVSSDTTAVQQRQQNRRLCPNQANHVPASAVERRVCLYHPLPEHKETEVRTPLLNTNY